MLASGDYTGTRKLLETYERPVYFKRPPIVL